MNLVVEDLVIAAGAFSKPLAKALGNTVPLDTERGYHVMLPAPEVEIRLPMLVSSLGFGITPMSDGLRLAGTVEFGGLTAPPNYARADAFADKSQAAVSRPERCRRRTLDGPPAPPCLIRCP